MKKAILNRMPNEIELYPTKRFRPKGITWEFPEPIYMMDHEGNTLSLMPPGAAVVTTITEDEWVEEYELILRKVKRPRTRSKGKST